MPRLKPFLEPQSAALTASGLLFMRVMAAVLLFPSTGCPSYWTGAGNCSASKIRSAWGRR